MAIARLGAKLLFLVCCAATSAFAHAGPATQTEAFEGRWSVKWCDRTGPDRDCGGFSVDLQQEGDRIEGETFGARVGLAQTDEGGIVHGIAVGDAAVLTVESARSGAIYLVKATRHRDGLHWKVRQTVRARQQDIDIVAMDDVLAREGSNPVPSADQTDANTAAEPKTPPPPDGAPQSNPQPGPFAGVWQACDGATAPEACSRYVLLQRGDRICGTWSYVATHDAYEGRVIAHAVSPTEARHTHVCGRPGSEARTECDDGWDRIDKPLRLCDGKLVDLDSANGQCVAPYERASTSEGEVAELAQASWVEACLDGEVPPPDGSPIHLLQVARPTTADSGPPAAQMPDALLGTWRMGESPCLESPSEDADAVIRIHRMGRHGYEHTVAVHSIRAVAGHEGRWLVAGEESYLGSQRTSIDAAELELDGNRLTIRCDGGAETYARCSN